MEELLAAFLADLKDGGRSTFTLATYRQNLRTYFRWCTAQRIEPPEATVEHLKAYLRLFANARTRRLHLAGLRQFYGYLVNEAGVISADPTRAVDRTGKLVLPLPRIERRSPRVLTDEEQGALFKAARGDLEARILLRLMRFAGLRVSEVVGHRAAMYDPYTQASAAYQRPGLRICDIDFTRLKLDVRGKGAVEDLAYLDRHTAALILRWLPTLAHRQSEAPLFQCPDGQPRGTKWAFVRFHQLCTDAKVGRRLTLHMLRHTFLTRFLEAGGNLRAAQRLARHRNLETTLIYADFVEDGVLRAQFDAHNLDTDDSTPGQRGH